MNRADAYERVCNGILDRLRAGVAPWHKPWTGAAPCNLLTKRPYSGVNRLALGFLGRSPYWLTFNQARSAGWSVKAGAKGVPVLFVGERPVQANTDEEVPVRPVFRVFHVFNAHDVAGIPSEELANVRNGWSSIDEAERILANVQPRPVLTEGGEQAFYDKAADAITLPPRTAFDCADDFYATAFHELTHWTGHPSRLNRPTLHQAVRFGDEAYSHEELVAEMGAGILASLTGLRNEVLDRNASYVAHWLGVLQADPSMLVKAASQAGRAVDFLLDGQGAAH